MNLRQRIAYGILLANIRLIAWDEPGVRSANLAVRRYALKLAILRLGLAKLVNQMAIKIAGTEARKAAKQ